MGPQFSDLNAPRYRNGEPVPFDQLPHGLLKPPEVVAQEVAEEQAARQPYFNDTFAKLCLDDRTLVYYFEGIDVAYRSVPEGVEVLAVGMEEIARLERGLSQEELLSIRIKQP